MADKLSRKQLAVIAHNDPRSIRALENLFDQVTVTEPADLTALTTRVTTLEGQMTTVIGWGNHNSAGYITDAPSNGNMYGRQDGAWALVSVEFDFDDNEKLYFGTDNDSAIWYDGTDMFIDSRIVGTGIIRTNDASVYLGETGVIYSNKLCAV